MSLTEIWSRNSFDAECVRVTEENIQSVAAWCNGTIARLLTENPKKYVLFDAMQYNQHRRAKAFVGDWIILVNDELKHYRDEGFRRAYSQKTFPREEVFELMMNSLSVNLETCQISWENLAEVYTKKLIKIIEGE